MTATVGPEVMARETARLIASDKVEGTPVRRRAPSTCQVGLAGCRPLAVGIGVYCQPMLQISAQT
jgi:hypothetical protein